jgi:hypothetical protein
VEGVVRVVHEVGRGFELPWPRFLRIICNRGQLDPSVRSGGGVQFSVRWVGRGFELPWPRFLRIICNRGQLDPSVRSGVGVQFSVRWVQVSMGCVGPTCQVVVAAYLDSGGSHMSFGSCVV